MNIKKLIPEPIKKFLIKVHYIPEKIFLKVYYLASEGKLYVPDKLFQKWDVKIHSGVTPNIEHPKTYQEKLQWLKLYNRKPEYSKLVDKYEVRDYIAQTINPHLLTKCYGVFDDWNEINFNDLPGKFVIKCTHDSGSVAICYDKKNWDAVKARKKIENGLCANHFYKSREWPYKSVKPRIIVEELLEDSSQPVLNDYKIYCFNGIAKMILVCTERDNPKGACYNYFDLNWNILDISNERKSYLCLEKPTTIDDMIKYAEIIAKDIPFIRVDYYEVKGVLYFGELTFFSGGGRHPWKNREIDLMLGDWIELPKRKIKNR